MSLSVPDTALSPFRIVGLITSPVPIAVATRGDRVYVVASVGRCFHAYLQLKLRHAHVGGPLEGCIRSIATTGQHTVVGVKDSVYFFLRGRLLGSARHGTAAALSTSSAPSSIRVQHVLRVWWRVFLSIGSDHHVSFHDCVSGRSVGSSTGYPLQQAPLQTERSSEDARAPSVVAVAPWTRHTYNVLLLVAAERTLTVHKFTLPQEAGSPLQANGSGTACSSQGKRKRCSSASTTLVETKEIRPSYGMVAHAVVGSFPLPFGDAEIVSSLCPSHAAVGIVAVGSSKGSIVLFDVDAGAVLFHLTRGLAHLARGDARSGSDDAGMRALLGLPTGSASPGPALTTGRAITAIAFSRHTDGVLFAGSASGSVTVYDLASREPLETVGQCHGGAVTSLHALPGEPVVISSGTDNSIRVWLAELGGVSATGDPLSAPAAPNLTRGLTSAMRALTTRQGHCGDVLTAEFYDEKWLVSSGPPKGICPARLRADHLYNDAISRIMGTALTKQPPSVATAITCSTLREKQWASVLTLHPGPSPVYQWRMDTLALQKQNKGTKDGTSHGSYTLPTDHGGVTTTTCMAISLCGSFVVVGNDEGALEVFNLQSGRKRGALPPRHCGSVGSVYVGGNNDIIVSVGTTDCTVGRYSGELQNPSLFSYSPQYPWNSTKHAPSGRTIGTRSRNRDDDDDSDHLKVIQGSSSKIQLMGGVSAYDAPNGLLAVACRGSDTHVRIISCGAVARTLQSHGRESPATAMKFSRNSRQLFVVFDHIISVYDTLTGCLFDCLDLRSPITSLSIHPTDLLLSTTHVNSSGVYLWTNNLAVGLVPCTPHPSVAASVAANHAVSPRPVELPLSKADVLAGHTRSKESRESRSAEEANPYDEDGYDDDVEALESCLAPIPMRTTTWTADDVHSLPQLVDLPAGSSTGLTFHSPLSSRWAALAAFDTVKKASRPLLPPKITSAPFFIPMSKELHPTSLFVLPPRDKDSAFLTSLEEEVPRINPEDPVLGALAKGNVTAFISAVTSLPNSAVASRVEHPGLGLPDVLPCVLETFCKAVESEASVDLIQAALCRFLALHYKAIVCNESVLPLLRKLLSYLSASAYRVDDLSANFLGPLRLPQGIP